MVTLGVPYDADAKAHAASLAHDQAKTISDEIVAQGGPADLADKDVVALIAYLQRMGADYAKSIAKPAIAQGGN
jgi:cytochrome c oxidase cbb3-type subunit I/II